MNMHIKSLKSDFSRLTLKYTDSSFFEHKHLRKLVLCLLVILGSLRYWLKPFCFAKRHLGFIQCQSFFAVCYSDTYDFLLYLCIRDGLYNPTMIFYLAQRLWPSMIKSEYRFPPVSVSLKSPSGLAGVR